MASQISAASRYGMADEEGFQAHLRREPCTVVLFHGRQCPYSRKFETAFEEAAGGDEAWSFVVRECRTGGMGEVGDRHGIEVTPTVIAYRNGEPWRRLEAKPHVGLTPHRFQEWLDALDGGEADTDA